MPVAIDEDDLDEKDKKFRALDEGDIALLKTYGLGPYTKGIRGVEDDIKKLNGRIQEVVGIKESDTGLAPPRQHQPPMSRPSATCTRVWVGERELGWKRSVRDDTVLVAPVSIWAKDSE